MTLAAATLLFLDPSDPDVPAHEFALLWPELTPTEFDLMVSDVVAHGVRNPILLYDDDGTRYILDGLHRYRAARRASQPCPYTLFEGDRLAALAASNSLNDRRRHLDTSERLAVAAREQLAAEQDTQDGAPRPTTPEVAASMGVSTRHYQRAKARERGAPRVYLNPWVPSEHRPRLRRHRLGDGSCRPSCATRRSGHPWTTWPAWCGG